MADTDELSIDVTNPELIEKLTEQIVENDLRRKRPRFSSNDMSSEDNTAAFREMIREEMQTAVTKIENKLSALTSKIDKQGNQLNKIDHQAQTNANSIQNLRAEVDLIRRENFKDLEDMKNTIKKQVNDNQHLKGQLGDLTKEIQTLKSDRIQTQRKLIDHEARSRRNNLLFFGIDEEQNENTEEKLIGFLKNTLKLEVIPGIQRAHRLGRPKPKGTVFIGSRANQPRPIIVCFFDFKQREQIRIKRHELQRPYGIAEDLPSEIREARKSLQGQLQELKSKGQRATIVYPCKLIANGEVKNNIDVAKFSLELK